LGLDSNTLVFGFHQRNSDAIYSSIPLAAFSALQLKNAAFLILGGSKRYSEQALDLGLKNFIQLEHTGDDKDISLFLQTLDVFSHGRGDGETFGAVIAEAMSFGLPCLSHYVKGGSNAQPETMGPGGLFGIDVHDYTSKMQDLARSSTLRQDLGGAGLDLATEKYSPSATTVLLKSVYETVMGNGMSSSTFALGLNVVSTPRSGSVTKLERRRAPWSRVREGLSRLADRLSYAAYQVVLWSRKSS